MSTERDLVWLHRGDSDEIRYSIRSAVENMPYRQLWIVGDKPDWWLGGHIPYSHTTPAGVLLKSKHTATDHALIRVCEDDRVSESFVLMNDDFFILQPYDPAVTYHWGPLRQILDMYAGYGRTPQNSRWLRGMARNLRRLKRLGIPEPACYEVHLPMLFRRDLLRHTLRIGGQRRTMYGNLHPIGRHQRIEHDVKLYRERADLPRTPAFSTADEIWPVIAPAVAERFPTPTFWEAS